LRIVISGEVARYDGLRRPLLNPMLNLGMAHEEYALPRFIADAMLGKLARWMRVLGYDTLYVQEGDDHLIAALARAEGRILLTRDAELTRRKGLTAIHIRSQILQTQLNQVIRAVGAPSVDSPSRCMNCNGAMHPLTVEQAKPLVPPYVAKTQQTFQQCANCGQVYWQGTHWQHIRAVRNAILNKEEEI
jgi:uncharacterized protein with PIN domain